MTDIIKVIVKEESPIQVKINSQAIPLIKTIGIPGPGGTGPQGIPGAPGAPGAPASNIILSVNGQTGTVVLATSDLVNDSGFIDLESDPIFLASPAGDIVNDDITNLSNLSGVNTGDQDLSPYFNKSVDDLNDINEGITNKHFTQTEKTKLTGIASGATTNSSDATLLNRTNHTGTQLAVTISDIQTTITNNANVSANSAARHSAVTVTDSAEIDFVLVGQDITASIKTNSIDETKLDISTNASLDLADTSLQPGSNISLLTNNAGYLTSAPVSSVNSQTGVVVLIADHISDSATTKKFVTSADITKLSNLSGTNTGDQNLSAYFNKSVDDLDDITAGTTNKHFTDTEKTKLAGIATGASANDTDANLKNRANHTGTQIASTISDFQATVTANSNVTANTAARHTHANKALLDTYTQTEANLADAVTKKHDAVTVTDSSEINFTLTGQNITGNIIASSIDESKLDSSVNASLDLADTALQAIDLAGHIPYTGAAFNVDLGVFGLTAASLVANGGSFGTLETSGNATFGGDLNMDSFNINNANSGQFSIIKNATGGNAIDLTGATGFLVESGGNNPELGWGTGYINIVNSLNVTGLTTITKTTEQLRVAYNSNNYFSTVVASNGTVNLSATGTVPKFVYGSSVDLTTGSATANTYSLKIPSASALLTVPVPGVEEFLTDKRYFTITTGSARKEYTLNDIALTAGRVPYAAVNGRLTDSTSLLFNGTNLTTPAITVDNEIYSSNWLINNQVPTKNAVYEKIQNMESFIIAMAAAL